MRALLYSRTRKQPAYPAYLTMIPHLTPVYPAPEPTPATIISQLSHNYPAYLASPPLRDKRDKRLLFPLHYYIRARKPHKGDIPELRLEVS